MFSEHICPNRKEEIMKINKFAAVFGTMLILGGCGIPDEPVSTSANGAGTVSAQENVTEEAAPEETEAVTAGAVTEDPADTDASADTGASSNETVDETTGEGDETGETGAEDTVTTEVTEDGNEETVTPEETAISLDGDTLSGDDDDNRGCIGDEGLVW
jgi:hypothetical protein